MLVSVIIPCYNASDFIEESVASVLSQMHKEIEIICVDNRSSDNTLEVIKALAQKHDSLSAFSEETPGAPAARNHGLEKSRGEWVQFLDADDLLLPEKISQQIELAQQSANAPFVVGPYTRLEVATNKKSEVLPNKRPWHGLINNRLGITSANLFRRTALQKVNGFDLGLKSSQEYDLMFRLMKSDGEPLYATQPNTIIRSRSEGSISSADIGGNKHRFLQLTGRIATHLKKHLRKEYEDLGEEWRQSTFIKIHLNAVDGFPDSTSLFRAALPLSFKPNAHEFLPSWFRLIINLFGYPSAEKLRKRIK